MLSGVMDGAQEAEAEKLQCIGYDQFMQSLHCQFFHSGVCAVIA